MAKVYKKACYRPVPKNATIETTADGKKYAKRAALRRTRRNEKRAAHHTIFGRLYRTLYGRERKVHRTLHRLQGQAGRRACFELLASGSGKDQGRHPHAGKHRPRREK